MVVSIWWSSVSHSKQGSNYKEGLTPVLSLLTEGSRRHRHIRRYIKAQVTQPRFFYTFYIFNQHLEINTI